jgi:hypothetical protein
MLGRYETDLKLYKMADWGISPHRLSFLWQLIFLIKARNNKLVKTPAWQLNPLETQIEVFQVLGNDDLLKNK